MKKIIILITVLTSITFLNACGNKESAVDSKTQENKAVNAPNTEEKLPVDTAADLGVSSGETTKPKLPKLPAEAQADNQGDNTTTDNTNEKNIEADVKSILDDINKEENPNSDSGTTSPEKTDIAK
jgi:hypothetical protein